MPKFLFIELSSTCIDQIVFPASMEVLGNFYLLKATVHCANHHFTIAINSGTQWLYDDLYTAVQQYTTFQEVSYRYANGWYFAVYEKSVIPYVDNIPGDNNFFTLTTDKHLQKLETTKRQNDGFEKDVHKSKKRRKLNVGTNDSKDRKLKNEMQSTYIKNYRTAKKAKETESEKLSRQIKQKAYMRNYRNGLLIKTCKTFIIQLNLKFICLKFAMRCGHYQQKEKRKLLMSAQGVYLTKMM